MTHGKALPARGGGAGGGQGRWGAAICGGADQDGAGIGLLQEREERYALTGPLPPLAIPTTLQDSLMVRLDRLATVKGLAQLGATLGREFSYELLQAVSPWDEGTLRRGLQQLVEAEFLYQRGLLPQATYVFKHALIQEAAYQSLLRSTRQQYHQRIAQVVEARFPEIRETQPEWLAHHYTEARLNQQAVVYWQRAGQRALERSANLEAVAHLTKGLELLATLPDTSGRAQQELVVQTALGPALMVTKGYGAPEMLQTYARARSFVPAGGGDPAALPGIAGFVVLSPGPGLELRAARELGDQLFTLAQRVGDPALLLEAHYALGNTLNYLGEFAAAQTHLEQGVALYDPQQHHAHAVRYGQDPGVDVPSLCRCDLVVPGLSGPSSTKKPRGADAGPGRWRIPSAWHMPSSLRPGSISSAASAN